MIQKLYKFNILAFFIFCFVLATSVSAVAQVELIPQISPEEPVPGETFLITFTTEEATALYYYGIEVEYDQTRFSFQQVTAGSLMGDNPLQIADFVGESTIGASVVRTSGSGDGAGTVATLVFEVLPGAETGEATFFFSNADIRDTAGNPVSVTLPESVSIIVQETEFFTVHYNNPLEWETVNAYAFQSNDGPEYLPWPGEAMNLPPDGSVWYSYDIPTTFDRVIFNNGAGNQTADLERNTDGWFDGTQWFDEEPILGDTRFVTFSVDMNVQEDLGNFDITLGDMVFVRGDFNEFSLDNPLTEMDSGVYETEIEVFGSEGSNVEYKFFIDAGDDRTLPNGGWELLNDDPGLNRSFALGEANMPQILDTVFFNDNEGVVEPDPDTRMVTFSIDMSVQAELGNFDITLGDEVFVRGDFNDFSLENPLSLTSGVEYEASVEIEGNEGNEVEFKYYILAGDNRTLPNDGWELLNDDPGLNRSFALGEADVPQVLDTVFFNDNEGVVEPDPDTRMVTFSVDMSVQAELGNFDITLGDEVFVRGDFNEFSLENLMSLTSGVVYEASVEVSGEESSQIEFKYYILAGDERDLPNFGWELLNGDPDSNRSFMLGEADSPQILDTVFFNNDDELPGEAEITFANIQFPVEAVITEGQTVSVFAQVYIKGITDQNAEEPAGIQSWIAVNDTNTDPAEWDESVWQNAAFNSREGNNAEYTADIGEGLEPGTYYYASRFQYLDQEQVYGGTGAYWNEDSGVLTVEVATDFVDVWPGDTNNDGVVNEEDVLPLGIYWNQTGPARENATTEWTAQSAEVWDPVAATFADTDGSGIVNQTDLLAVGLNFGQAHGEQTQNTDPVLIVTLPFMNPGDRADITISAAEALDLQGLSYALDFSGADEGTYEFSAPQMASWADAWLEDGQLIVFNRVDEGVISGARVHRGITEPENTEDLLTFSITALEGWDQFSAELIIPRMTFVDQNGAMQRIEEAETEIVVESGTSTEGNELPRKTDLNQNYPNPFNPTTNISFDLSEPSLVTLEVVNILGQRVAVLLNRDDMSAGSHVKSFDASRLTSGVYLLRMTAGNQTYTRKMMLVK